MEKNVSTTVSIGRSHPSKSKIICETTVADGTDTITEFDDVTDEFKGFMRSSSDLAAPPPTPENAQMREANDFETRGWRLSASVTGANYPKGSAKSTLVEGSETRSSTAPIRQYQLIHLDTGDKSYTTEEIHSSLVATGLRYDVLTMFPVKNGLWELLVFSQSLDKFRTYTTLCGFDIAEYSPPSRGIFFRASIIRHQARRTQDTQGFLWEAALFYDNLLKSYSYLSVLIDIASAIFSIPISVVIGHYLYRRRRFCFILTLV